MSEAGRKSVLITGATGAIGQACARAFGAEGYHVYLHYRSDAEGARALQGELASAETITFDVADTQSVNAALESIAPDVLVNNAGITRDVLFYWMDEAAWNDVIQTNLGGLYAVTKAVIGKMIQKKRGAIVNVASVSGISGNIGQCNYSASKGGMIAFTKSLALEMARYKIRVNCVAPGFIESEMTKELDRTMVKKTIPLGRVGKPEEVAEAVLFLAHKASYITAETVNISGGMVR